MQQMLMWTVLELMLHTKPTRESYVCLWEVFGGQMLQDCVFRGIAVSLWEFETTFGILFNRKSCFTGVWGLSDSDLLVLWPSLTDEGFLWPDSCFSLLLKPPAGFVAAVALSTWSQPLETAFAKRSASITGEGYANREVYLFKEGLVTC